MDCEETKATHVSLVVLIPIDANDTMTCLYVEHLGLAFTLRRSEMSQFLRSIATLTLLSQEGQSLHIVLTPGLYSDAVDMQRLLSSGVKLDRVLRIGLSATEHRRLRAVHIRQLDRINTNADASLELCDNFIGEGALAEQTVILGLGELREFEVAAGRGSIKSKALDWGQRHIILIILRCQSNDSIELLELSFSCLGFEVLELVHLVFVVPLSLQDIH